MSDLPAKVRQLELQLAAREQEVAALREIAEAAAELQSHDVQGAKVIELSKKNRSLNLLLEKERTKVAKLQQALSQASPTKQASSGESKTADAQQQELTALKERAQQMTNRMGQMEQKVFLLENENRKLTRALLREVGEGVPLTKVLDEGTGSDWKGRREQIIRLQDTIKQLKEAAGSASPPAGATGTQAGSMAKHDTAHRNLIGKLNKQKNSELQRMAEELEAARAASEALRLKFTGASSRRKVLEEEVAGLKDKLSVVLSKTKNDDRLIAALRSELVAATRGTGASARSAAAAADPDGSSFEVSQQRCSQLEEQVEQQQKVIRYLQAQLESSKGGGASGPQQLQAEVERLRQQLAVLQLAASSAGGSAASALQQQVLVLQEDNAQMQQQLRALQGARAGLHLTQSDIVVLEAAKEAVDVLQDGEEVGSDGGEEEEEEEEEEGSQEGDCGDDEGETGDA